MDTTSYVIEMHNDGGLLDSRLIKIPGDGSYHGSDLAAQLISMIQECGLIEPGDTFTVRYAR